MRKRGRTLNNITVSVLVLTVVLMFTACPNPNGPEDDDDVVLTLSGILSDYAGTYYSYVDPPSYGGNLEKYTITTTETSFTLNRVAGAFYRESYDWNPSSNPNTYTVTGFTEQSGPHAVVLAIEGIDTTILIYDDGDFDMDYNNGTSKSFYTEMNPAYNPYFAYDINDESVFAGGKVWYCENPTFVNDFYAYKVDKTGENEFDLDDRYYTGSSGSWGVLSGTTGQHITISEAFPDNASRYKGIFSSNESPDAYVALEFFSETRADMIFYTDSSYTEVTKIGGLTEASYEMYTDPSIFGIPPVLFISLP